MRLIMAAILLSLPLAGAAVAAKGPAIEVRDAWIRATPPGATTAAGYLTLSNHGPASDRLMGGSTPVAQTLEVHEMSTSGGIMRMRAMPGGLAIGASATVKLTPNGEHLMFIGLKRPLKDGQRVKTTLDFNRAGHVVVDFPVRAAAPGGGVPGMHM